MRNFVRDWVAERPADDPALITLDADGARREWTFGELLDAAGVVRRRVRRARRAPRRRRADPGRQRHRVRAEHARVPADRRRDAAVQRAAARRRTSRCGSIAPVRRWCSATSAIRPRSQAAGADLPGAHRPGRITCWQTTIRRRTRTSTTSTRRSSCSPPARAARRSWSRTASATSGASSCRRSTGSAPSPASWSGRPPRPAGRSRRATLHRAVVVRRRRPAAGPPLRPGRAAGDDPRASVSTSCAWRRRSTG